MVRSGNSESGLWGVPGTRVARNALRDHGYLDARSYFLDVSADFMEHVYPIFYGDPKTAANKVLGGGVKVQDDRGNA